MQPGTRFRCAGWWVADDALRTASYIMIAGTFPAVSAVSAVSAASAPGSEFNEILSIMRVFFTGTTAVKSYLK